MMDGGGITPFRMQVLLDIAARVVKIMVTGAWHLSFEEMEFVLEIIHREIKASLIKNQERGEEDT